MSSKLFCNIVIIEDDESTSSYLVQLLERAGFGFKCTAFSDPEKAWAYMISGKIVDCVLLDCMLPNMSGYEFCRKVRSNTDLKSTPVIMLTAKSESSNKIEGFDAGADDYISKPFNNQELLVRLRAVLRRTRPSNSDSELQCGELKINLVTMEVKIGSRRVKLSAKEFKILKMLMEYPGKVYSRDQILQTVWDNSKEKDKEVDARTIDVHINRLRTAVGCDKSGRSFIRTIRCFGYSLNISDSDDEDEGMDSGASAQTIAA